MSLAAIEVDHLLKICMQYRETISVRKMELEERRRSEVDGHVNSAIIACENEIYLMTGIIQKLAARQP